MKKNMNCRQSSFLRVVQLVVHFLIVVSTTMVMSATGDIHRVDIELKALNQAYTDAQKQLNALSVGTSAEQMQAIQAQQKGILAKIAVLPGAGVVPVESDVQDMVSLDQRIEVLKNECVWVKNTLSNHDQGMYAYVVFFIDQQQSITTQLQADLLYRLIACYKSVLLKLEVLTNEYYDATKGTSTQAPLSSDEYQRCVLKIFHALCHDFEKYSALVGCNVFSLEVLDTKYIHDAYLTNLVTSTLPQELQKRWWAQALMACGISTKRALLHTIISYNFYNNHHDLGEAYLKAVYNTNEQSALLRLNALQAVLVSLQQRKENVFKEILQSTCNRQLRAQHRHGLLVGEFLMTKLLKMKSDLAKQAYGFYDASKTHVHVKHKVLCEDKQFQLLLKNKIVFDYFNRYTKVVEHYLYNNDYSVDFLYELYAIIAHVKRLKNTHALSAVGSLLYQEGLVSQFIDALIENLELIIGEIRHQGSASKQLGTLDQIFSGGWIDANASNKSALLGYADHMIESQVTSLKKKAASYVGPLLATGLVKYIGPLLVGDDKEKTKDGSSSSGELNECDVDKIAERVKEKLRSFVPRS